MIQIIKIFTYSGVIYLATLTYILSQEGKKKINVREQLLIPIMKQFHSEKLQQLGKNIGWDINTQKFNIIRYGVAASYFTINSILSYLRGETIDFNLFFITALIIYLTSPLKLSPFGWTLLKIRERRLVKKDSEIIAFLKLYQNSRRQKYFNLQLWSFCIQVAPHFQYIRHELNHLSERLHEDDIEKALDWLVSCYPSEHPYINEIRSIILATENSHDQETAIQYLNSQNQVISDMSRDQYENRWSLISAIATIINALPGALALMMIIILCIQYIFVMNKNSIMGF